MSKRVLVTLTDRAPNVPSNIRDRKFGTCLLNRTRSEKLRREHENKTKQNDIKERSNSNTKNMPVKDKTKGTLRKVWYTASREPSYPPPPPDRNYLTFAPKGIASTKTVVLLNFGSGEPGQTPCSGFVLK